MFDRAQDPLRCARTGAGRPDFAPFRVIAGGDPDDPGVRGAREALQVLAAEPRLDATVLQTVGGKGWDGFAYAVVVAD